MKPKRTRWTPAEDATLLSYQAAVGADFVACHDLGRAQGAGSRRLSFLTASGARLAYAQMRLAMIEFYCAAGHSTEDREEAEAQWRSEILLLTDGIRRIG